MRTLARVLLPLQRRLQGLILRGVVRLVDDSAALQVMQVETAPNVLRTCTRLACYGIATYPLAGSEALLVAVGADPSNGVVIATEDRRYRPRIAPGEVALYTDEGLGILLRRGKIVEICGSSIEISGALKVNGSITCQENISVGGSIHADGDVGDGSTTMAAMRMKYNGHVHGSAVGPTDPPTPKM